MNPDPNLVVDWFRREINRRDPYVDSALLEARHHAEAIAEELRILRSDNEELRAINQASFDPRQSTPVLELIAVARQAADKQAEAVAIMRKNGFKFETRLDLSEGFEKLAFTFYTMLCEIDDRLRTLLKPFEEEV